MKSLQYIHEAVARFEHISQEGGAIIVGCTPAEVDALEATLKPPYTLPAAYREFLEWGANQWGRLFLTRDLAYPSVFANARSGFRDWEEAVYPEDDGHFPDNLFIFEDGQGSYFSFFYLDAGENPPVYCWKETMDSFEDVTLVADRFSEYLMQVIEIHERVLG